MDRNRRPTNRTVDAVKFNYHLRKFVMTEENPEIQTMKAPVRRRRIIGDASDNPHR